LVSIVIIMLVFFVEVFVSSWFVEFCCYFYVWCVCYLFRVSNFVVPKKLLFIIGYKKLVLIIIILLILQMH